MLCGCDDFWLRISRCSLVIENLLAERSLTKKCHPAFICAGGSFACPNPASKPLLLGDKTFQTSLFQCVIWSQISPLDFLKGIPFSLLFKLIFIYFKGWNFPYINLMYFFFCPFLALSGSCRLVIKVLFITFAGIPLIICGITIAGNVENYNVED